MERRDPRPDYSDELDRTATGECQNDCQRMAEVHSVTDAGPDDGGWISGGCGSTAEPLIVVESRAGTAEMDERCFSFTVVLLRTHRTVAPRPGDTTPLCACGRPALCCEVNSALRGAGLLDPIDPP